MELSAYIEALLFYKAEPIAEQELAKLTNTTEFDVAAALTELARKLETAEHGIRLLQKDGAAALVTAPGLADYIEQIRTAELSKDIGKAGRETLAIILYNGPISRSEIDYIRGVNSVFILRNLMIRGLVERVADPDDQRSYLYRPTVALLSHLGITQRSDLPDYETVQKELRAFAQTAETDEEGGEGDAVASRPPPDEH